MLNKSHLHLCYNFVTALLDLIWPRHCIACNTELFRNEKYLCLNCLEEMPLTYFWQQERNPMARKFNAAIQSSIDKEGFIQEDCKKEGGESSLEKHREQYACAIALYFYRGGYRNLSQALKYHANMSAGNFAASLLAEKTEECPFLKDVDSVIAVPLHKWRRLRRGYNQAEIIASAICRRLNIRQIFWLKRIRRTPSQTKMSGMAAKKANVSGAFSAVISKNESAAPVHILLVDDVFTSGSTLSECHRALRRALIDRFGPRIGNNVRISIATLAFVGE